MLRGAETKITEVGYGSSKQVGRSYTSNIQKSEHSGFSVSWKPKNLWSLGPHQVFFLFHILNQIMALINAEDTSPFVSSPPPPHLAAAACCCWHNFKRCPPSSMLHATHPSLPLRFKPSCRPRSGPKHAPLHLTGHSRRCSTPRTPAAE